MHTTSEIGKGNIERVRWRETELLGRAFAIFRFITFRFFYFYFLRFSCSTAGSVAASNLSSFSLSRIFFFSRSNETLVAGSDLSRTLGAQNRQISALSRAILTHSRTHESILSAYSTLNRCHYDSALIKKNPEPRQSMRIRRIKK